MLRSVSDSFSLDPCMPLCLSRRWHFRQLIAASSLILLVACAEKPTAADAQPIQSLPASRRRTRPSRSLARSSPKRMPHPNPHPTRTTEPGAPWTRPSRPLLTRPRARRRSSIRTRHSPRSRPERLAHSQFAERRRPESSNRDKTRAAGRRAPPESVHRDQLNS